MELARFWRHVRMNPITAARCFPSATLDAIQREIAAQEAAHRGEICFVLEAELPTSQLWQGVTPRERARQVFALQGVWNTEENNGVLAALFAFVFTIFSGAGLMRGVRPGWGGGFGGGGFGGGFGGGGGGFSGGGGGFDGGGASGSW